MIPIAWRVERIHPRSYHRLGFRIVATRTDTASSHTCETYTCEYRDLMVSTLPRAELLEMIRHDTEYAAEFLMGAAL